MPALDKVRGSHSVPPIEGPDRRFKALNAYLVVDDPLPPVAPPVLGEVGAGDVVLDELPPGEVLELEPVLLLPPAAAPDLLKWASHSEREICPSLFLSTAVKLGVEALDEPPADDMPEEPLELLPVAEGEDDEEPDAPDAPEAPVELLPDADGDDEEGLLGEEEDCATASDDSAKSTAAAVMLRVLIMNELPYGCDLHPPMRKRHAVGAD